MGAQRSDQGRGEGKWWGKWEETSEVRGDTSLLTLGPPDLDSLFQLCRLTRSSLSLYQAVCFGLVPKTKLANSFSMFFLKKALSLGQRR